MPLPQEFTELNGYVVGYDKENDVWTAEINGERQSGSGLEIAQALWRAEERDCENPLTTPWLHASDDGVRICNGCLLGTLLDNYAYYLYDHEKMALYAIYRFFLEKVSDDDHIVSQTPMGIALLLGKEALTQMPGSTTVGHDEDGWIVLHDGVRVRDKTGEELALQIYENTPGFDTSPYEGIPFAWQDEDGNVTDELLERFFASDYIVTTLGICKAVPSEISSNLVEFGVDEELAEELVGDFFMQQLLSSLGL